MDFSAKVKELALLTQRTQAALTYMDSLRELVRLIEKLQTKDPRIGKGLISADDVTTEVSNMLRIARNADRVIVLISTLIGPASRLMELLDLATSEEETMEIFLQLDECYGSAYCAAVHPQNAVTDSKIQFLEEIFTREQTAMEAMQLAFRMLVSFILEKDYSEDQENLEEAIDDLKEMGMPPLSVYANNAP